MCRNPLNNLSVEHDVAGMDASMVATSYSTGSRSHNPSWNILSTIPAAVFAQELISLLTEFWYMLCSTSRSSKILLLLQSFYPKGARWAQRHKKHTRFLIFAVKLWLHFAEHFVQGLIECIDAMMHLGSDHMCGIRRCWLTDKCLLTTRWFVSRCSCFFKYKIRFFHVTLYFIGHNFCSVPQKFKAFFITTIPQRNIWRFIHN